MLLSRASPAEGHDMKRRKLTKAAMAKQMKTSRSALDRLLNPENSSVTLLTLERAASVSARTTDVESG
ncbi:MAG: hypothetical protein HY741_10790 [Chloroflexi bacterium]|nr:hypothetical protein [Chloroflexota bacterium]